ncbi:MAG: Mur ligase domain-containing protein [Bdellovibrionota bacterium]
MKIFFSGIGGSGVSAIASFMADKGHTVVGSDRSFDTDKSHPAYAPLVAKGITIVPQDGAGINSSFDQIVFSTAVEKDLPEPQKAAELGIPIKMRPEFLAELVSSHRTFAVAGTSGKSTTSGMLAYMMRELNLSPNFIGGGRVSQFKELGNLGNSIAGSSQLLVVEACESDGSIVSYKPEFTILHNLELDHHSVEKTAVMFTTLANNTAKKTLVNADDVNLSKLSFGNAVTYGISNEARYRGVDLQLKPLASEFTVDGVKFYVNMPGLYNVYNALACVATLAEFGIPLKDLVRPLETFRGIDRRFDVYLNDGKSFVMDDYAHNPHKIASMMQMAQKIQGSITYIYQPHGFAPTRMMKNEYIEAFAKNLRPSDRLVLFPIFYVGGTVAKDISSEDLAAGVRALGKMAVIGTRAEVLAQAKAGESFIVFGARDESLAEFAKSVAEKLEPRVTHRGITAVI